MASHYCHECDRLVAVETVNSAPQCVQCHGEFVEEATPEDIDPGIAHGFGPEMQDILLDFFGHHTQEMDAVPVVPRANRGLRAVRAERGRRRAVPRGFMLGFVQGFMGDGGQFGGNLGDYAFGEQGFSQILTNLMNQPAEPVQRISPEDIARLPTTEVNEKQIENEVQCITCMEPFKLKEKVAILNCEHIFHRDCIEPWLRTRDTCPICRAVIDPTKWPQGQMPCEDIWELD